jgi:hypothetical protein
MFPSCLSLVAAAAFLFIPTSNSCPHHVSKRQTPSAPASALLDRTLLALGGSEALNQLQAVTYHSPTIYRTQTLMQNYNLFASDQFVSIEGHQNISFSFSPTDPNILHQRIDRLFHPSPYWIWGKGNLDAIDFSLVVSSDSDDEGFACYVRGNDEIYMDASYTAGYTDAALAEYLIARAGMLSPKLMARVKAGGAFSETTIELREGVELAGGTYSLTKAQIFERFPSLIGCCSCSC